MSRINQNPLNLLMQWKMMYRNPSSVSSLPTFLSLTPTITAIHHCRWSVTADGPQPLLSKAKRRGEAHGPAVTWERPGPVHASATHTRGPIQMTQRQAGKRTKRCSGRRTTEEWTQGPSFVTALICQFSPGLLKRIGVTCIREGWAIMWAVQASISFLSMSEVAGVTYLSAPNGIKSVTSLLWDITCGTTTSKVISDTSKDAAQTMFMLKEMIHWISIKLNGFFFKF